MRLRLALAVLAAALLGVATSTAPAASDPHTLQVSSSPSRSGAEALEGRTVSGVVYVFASPDSGSSARFWLDDPAMAGLPRQVENNAPWDFAGGNTDGTARPFDTRTISNGAHTITVAVTQADGSLDVAHARFTVDNATAPPAGSYQLLVSSSPDRSSPASIEGRTVSGTIYAFAKPDSGSRVRFWLDDAAMSGTPRTVENNAPWDFVGGNKDGTARPFDTRTLSDGVHTISVAVTETSGAVAVAHARFTVANTTTAPALGFDRESTAFAVEPGGNPPSQSVLLTSSGGTPGSFTVSDTAPWLSVTPSAGTTPAALTLEVQSAALQPGSYSATVTASAPGFVGDTLAVTLSVAAAAPPDQIHLAWTEDPATTLTVVWRTRNTATPSTTQWRAVGTAEWQTAAGGPRPSGTAGTLHEVTLRSLSPASAYEYRVAGDGGQWSPVLRARTAPAPGPASFEAIYVADTGLIGRADGLATGTEQVRDEIAALDPLLVLGGGDYAYFNTDQRYGTLEATIDAWFNQMQPISSRAVLMPTYGNHEAILGEGYSNWAARFPTPAGFDARRNYSFDVGDVHFVSIFAVNETTGLTSATLQWIEDDIVAAKARGRRWIVPFFHVSPFADGSSHPSNLSLRAQLGPLFERLGVKVVLASHDQSYERTYPLVDVPATNTPTSASKHCYSMSDGVSWVKVSPGGKLSSKNGDFSKFRTFPPPAYTAFRDDTIHHFARLRVSSAGVMRVEAWAVPGDGSPPFVQDAFEYRLGGCPPELRLEPQSRTLHVDEGGQADTQLTLSSSNGQTSGVQLTDDAPWLTVTGTPESAPRDVAVRADASALEPGTYRATVTASASGYLNATATVTLVVREAHRLMVSASALRGAAVPLEGAVLSGVRYIFVAPDAGATGVSFWLDNPTMSGAPRTVENNPPWDFAGGNKDGTARPFDTRTIANGTHVVTARVALEGGGFRDLRGTFTVANG